MGWNYANFTKIAKQNGGPEAFMQKLISKGEYKGRISMYPVVGCAMALGVLVGAGIHCAYTKIVEKKKSKESEEEKMSKYYVKMIYPNGNEVMEDESFDSYEAAEEHALYCRSCYSEGAETLYMSNPGDYPYDEDEEPDYEILTEDEIEEWD